MKADIFYSKAFFRFDNVQPGLDERLHFSGDDSPIHLPMAKFTHWWKKVASVDVPDASGASLDKLFSQFNDGGYGGRNPLSTPAGQEKVRKSGTHHTSMSVGDVIKLGKEYFIVQGIGFSKLVVGK